MENSNMIRQGIGDKCRLNRLIGHSTLGVQVDRTANPLRLDMGVAFDFIASISAAHLGLSPPYCGALNGHINAQPVRITNGAPFSRVILSVSHRWLVDRRTRKGPSLVDVSRAIFSMANGIDQHFNNNEKETPETLTNFAHLSA